MRSLETYLKELDALALLHPAGAGELSLRRLRAGQSVCEAGEPVQALELLVEGELHVLSLSAEGNWGTVARSQPSKLIGDIEFFHKKAFLHTVIAHTDAVLIRFPLHYIHTYLEQDVAFYRFLCLELMEKLYSTSFSYARRLTFPAENRLAAWLLSHEVGGSLRLIQTQVARELGITPRHMGRLLARFRAEGLLQPLGPKEYRITDLAQLRRLAQDL